MNLIRIPKSWEIKESQVTSSEVFFHRRKFLKTLIGVGVVSTILPLVGCQSQESTGKSKGDIALESSLNLPALNAFSNPKFQEIKDRPITNEQVAGSYNNFYEFGGTKHIWQNAQKLPLDNWKVEVTGLIKNPRTYDLDDLKKSFPIEERTYRFRCVEAWSMVLPWVGFPMKALIEAVQPTSKAKFVRFTSFYDKNITYGPLLHLGKLPWPYQESLTLQEMYNDLAFFAIGIYGHELPKQHGAPLRMVMPWKYGFKGAKSIVKIEFVSEQPATYWNTLIPEEYDFQANVNPSKPHPRWSQATEKFIGSNSSFSWEIKNTLPYNGYGEYVGNLYT